MRDGMKFSDRSFHVGCMCIMRIRDSRQEKKVLPVYHQDKEQKEILPSCQRKKKKHSQEVLEC